MNRLVPHLGVLLLAALSTALLVVPHSLGWRVHVEALSGNLYEPELVLRGALYGAAWVQWVVLAPALAAGGALGLIWEIRLSRR